MRRRPVRTAVIGLSLLLAVAGCGGGDDDDSGGAATTTTAATDESTTTTSAGAVADTEWDQVMFDAIDDVQAFWVEAYPAVYGDEYFPISGGFWPYTSESEPPPCGDPPPSYAEIAENAFYCPSADLVAWDSEILIPRMYEQFGPFSLGLVMAHELGHAIQARVPVEGPTILTEQQADCFAGAWTAWAAENSSVFEITLAELDAAVAGFLQLADVPGQVSSDPSAHGSAFDRVGAYEDGFLNGAVQCATYETSPPPTFQLPFSSEEEFESGGNLPYEDVEPLVVQDLEFYWSLVFPDVFGVEWDPVDGHIPYDPNDGPTCGGDSFDPEILAETAFYCVPEDYIAWDEVNLMPGLYDNIGDFAQGIIIANQYSLAAQVRLGNLSNDVESNLQADCFTGTWAASMVPGFRSGLGLPEDLVISPGDLDEAVTAFLAFGDSAEDVDAGVAVNGTAFQRVHAFRDGFLNGIGQCNTYLSGGAPADQSTN